jgi:predicted enzyme related to lactoylglutathione lyase
MRYAIEAITLPVGDVDRAKAFYEQAGWHLDVDTEPAPGIRVVQFTPPGSDCSITFGTGMPQSEPGSYRNTYLVVADIEPAHRELRERGIEISDIFHFGPEGQTPGLDPKRGDYGSYASFADPDGNTWLLQEVPSRGREAVGAHDDTDDHDDAQEPTGDLS